MEEELNLFSDRIKAAMTRKAEMQIRERQNNELRHNIDKLTEKVSELESDLKNALLEKESLHNAHDAILRETSEEEQLCNKIEQGLQLKSSDQTRMTKAKEITRIAIDLTGIRYDYSAPENVIRGYIANKFKGTIAPFHLEKNENNEEELWDIIETNYYDGWADLVETSNGVDYLINKENVPKN